MYTLNKTFVGSRFDFIENSSVVSGCRAVYRRRLAIVTSGVKIEGTLDAETGRLLTQLDGQLRVVEAKDVSVSNIRVRAPTSDGFVVEHGGAAMFSNCEAMYCGQSGMCIRTGGRADTYDCNFSSNLRDGITALNESSWFRATRGKLHCNGQDGVFVGQKAYGDLSNSSASNNQQYGVCASEEGVLLLHASAAVEHATFAATEHTVVMQQNRQGNQGHVLGGKILWYEKSTKLCSPSAIRVRLCLSSRLKDNKGHQSQEHLDYLTGRTGIRLNWNPSEQGFRVLIDGAHGLIVTVKARNLMLCCIEEIRTVRYTLVQKQHMVVPATRINEEEQKSYIDVTATLTCKNNNNKINPNNNNKKK